MASLRTLIIVMLATVLVACISAGSSRPARSAASDDDAAQFNLELGIRYLRQNKLDAAQLKLEKAIEQDPGLVTAHTALGVLFERLDDADGAEKHYRQAASLGPDDPNALNALAVFLCGQRQESAEALKLFDRAVAVPLSKMPANRAMLYTNAGVCARQVDLARAEGYLRTAINLDPAYAAALLEMAEVSLARSNGLQARAFLERYLGAVPASPGALWLGYRIEQSLADADAAGRYGDRLRSEFPESVERRQLDQQDQG